MSQGARANANGKELEKKVEKLISKFKYRKQPKFISIYGHKSRIDFDVDIGDKRYGIECKTQTSGGSTDEKLPYVMSNAIVYPDHFVLVLDGDGGKKGARPWAKAFAKYVSNDNHEIAVLTLKEFEEWLDNKLAA